MDTKAFTSAEFRELAAQQRKLAVDYGIRGIGRQWVDRANAYEQAARQAEELERVSKQEHVGWCRYQTHEGDITSFEACDSDAPGAFKVYRFPSTTERSKS